MYARKKGLSLTYLYSQCEWEFPALGWLPSAPATIVRVTYNTVFSSLSTAIGIHTFNLLYYSLPKTPSDTLFQLITFTQYNIYLVININASLICCHSCRILVDNMDMAPYTCMILSLIVLLSYGDCSLY